MTIPKLTLNSGIEIPAIGFGTYKSQPGDEVENSVRWALEAGYRLIDTAKVYGNEEGVGRAIRQSAIPREDIFVTTKLAIADQGYEQAMQAIDESLAKLGLSYVDLYLIHWPSASEDRFESINKREETWKAMEDILKAKKARAIGVSNYTLAHLEEMQGYADTSPAVNQVEFHPFLYQRELLEYCRQKGILIEAYAPLVKARKMDNEQIVAIAKKHQKTGAQVLLRWSIQRGCLPIPKSVHRERIQENIAVFDFELAAEDMAVLDSLNEGIHQSWDPTKIQ